VSATALSRPCHTPPTDLYDVYQIRQNACTNVKSVLTPLFMSRSFADLFQPSPSSLFHSNAHPSLLVQTSFPGTRKPVTACKFATNIVRYSSIADSAPQKPFKAKVMCSVRRVQDQVRPGISLRQVHVERKGVRCFSTQKVSSCAALEFFALGQRRLKSS
jgi:hypothetical protein